MEITLAFGHPERDPSGRPFAKKDSPEVRHAFLRAPSPRQGGSAPGFRARSMAQACARERDPVSVDVARPGYAAPDPVEPLVALAG